MPSKVNVKAYWDTVNMPWGKLFYKLVWNHLDYKGKKILDFGSGFGITSDFLARNNDVTAIEPGKDMLVYRVSNNSYKQVIGGTEELKKLKDNYFDVIICHNVLEYADNRRNFWRILQIIKMRW